MEIIATDEKPKPPSAYSGPPPLPMHRIPPHEGSHGPPSAHGLYEPPPAWRPSYPSAYDAHPAEPRRASNPPQPPLPSHNYSIMPNRELPQLPPDGPYGRPSSLPGPTHTPPEHPLPPPNYRPMNGTPHEAAPHSAPPDFRPRMSFPPQEPHPNGEPPLPAHSIPPTQYATTPVPHIPNTPTPYDAGYYQNQALGMRQRKAARAQQEKATQLLLDRMQQLEDRLEDRMTQLQSIQVEQGSQLSRLLSAESKLKEPKVIPTKEAARPPSQKQTSARLLKPDAPESLRETKAKDENVPFIVGQDVDGVEPAEESLKAEDDGELSIPVEHTTAAHKLLHWPSIKSLLWPREYDEDYVMKLEEERGLIRVYGRGEGDNTSEDTGMLLTPSNSTPVWDESYNNGASPSGPWSNPAAAPPPKRDNGLEESGVLTTDPETVRRYHQCYMDNIQKLHPFLDQNELEKKIEVFIKLYCPQKASGSTPIMSNAGEIPRGAKRKRSCETLQGAGCDVQSSPGSKPERYYTRRIEKSIDNAIILLVLAVGSICEWRDLPVPGPVRDTPVDFRKERIPGPPTNSILSPAGSDPAIPQSGSFYAPTSNAFPSPSMLDGRKGLSGRSMSLSRDGSDTRHLRNLDVIPGLAYYAYATQILGSLQGANGLLHVQAALLAGLYAGQLAHPFQSHGWIYQAARACQVLVRSKRYEQMQDGPLKDLYDFAYWTCLQLESDILAELDLPASGISRSEARISLPKGRFTLSLPNEICAPSTMMMFFYSAQIHLRKVLNRVHTDLYKVEKVGQNRWSSNVQEILSMNLELWRSSLPEVMKWRDTDPPSKEINVARMRAKYYGARYIIHRPLLYHALHFGGQNDRSTSVDSPTGSAMSGSKSQQVSPSMTHSQRATNMMRLSSDMGPSTRAQPPSSNGNFGVAYHYRDLPTKLRRACKVCVDSAILSTEAFDGIEGRPVVTNIFGTAHAQFGNMLVLSATFMSNLSELVDRTVLERLLKRTIYFLLRSQYISPSLRADAKILTEIYEKIFQEPAGSFSTEPSI
ncbi:hypothetical protein MW887_002997 [Aspergillus wentii]|nr:hypothetical protein MW887_002997 [Aspergillus wentii]